MDLALADFRDLVALGLSRGADLLTMGEERIARGMLALDGPPAVLYARLTNRVRPAFRLDELVVVGVDDVRQAVGELEGAGFADRLVPSAVRASLSTRPRLIDAARALGLPTSGRKDQLVARVGANRDWDRTDWVRIRHRALVRRLERWALLRAFPDRGTRVVARLGLVRWPEYPLTPGPGLFRDRRRLLAWEALLAGPTTVDQALEALRTRASRGPGRLDLGRWLVQAVRDAARITERADPEAASAIYRDLAATGAVRPPAIAVRWARCEERAGRPAEALAILRRARAEDARPSEDLAIGRAGRRLGRRLRSGLPPAPPLAPRRERSIRLEPAEPLRGRPRWASARGPRFVEEAVSDLVEGLGRRVLRAEAAPWSTLFAVLCADLYFLPIPGALPVPFLSGPLDLGTPRFREARRAACESLLAELDRGRGAELVASADPRWRGLRLAGAHWESAEADVLQELAAGLGPRGLRTLVEALLDHGPRAAAGLPDLVVLPGPEVRAPDAHPAKIPPGLLLAEVKGPGDVLRDEQIVWLDRLGRAGAAIEVWEVSARLGRP